MKLYLHMVYESGQDIESDEQFIETSGRDYIVVEDNFGRKFKLEPVTNENIKFPFIITPLFDEVKK